MGILSNIFHKIFPGSHPAAQNSSQAAPGAQQRAPHPCLPLISSGHAVSLKVRSCVFGFSTSFFAIFLALNDMYAVA